MKSNISPDGADFEPALRLCREVAEMEFAVTEEALARAEATAIAAREKIVSLLDLLPDDSRPGDSTQSSGMPDAIKGLGEEITRQIEDLIGGTRRSLHAKRPRLGKFTVALYGRTMAGKSTFREAITHGDGSTIGRGAQNTTKRTHEYEWNGINIIDTPGIGAFKGERYRQQAISVIGKSDVVLFFLSDDGIQKEGFEAMKAILQENKPVFFVLNVKRNLEKDLHRSKFIANPDSLLGTHRIDGHYHRIRKLAVESLGMPEARIFPIHAQAAFFATQSTDDAGALYRASRMDALHAALCHEVSANGPVRRLQTILDGAIGALEGLKIFYAAQGAKLKQEAVFFRKKLDDFSERLSKFRRDYRSRITDGVVEAFAPLRAQVFDFIEENIERKDIAHRWEQRVKSANIDLALKRVQKTAVSAVGDLVRDFTREIQIDAELAGADSPIGNPQQANVWDIRKGLNRGSVVAGVLGVAATVAVNLGAPNFWNPIGWVLIGVGAVDIWIITGRVRRVVVG